MDNVTTGSGVERAEMLSLPGVPLIETERLNIREMRMADAERYYQSHCNPAALAYYDWIPESFEAARQGIEDIREDYRTLQYIHWGIASRDTDALIGDVGIYRLDGKGEVNFFMEPSFQGKGLMREALGALVSWCFQDTELYRIQAMTVPENQGANRLLQRLGFSMEGILRKYGYNGVRRQYTDLMMWSLLKAECEPFPFRLTGYLQFP